MSFWIKYIHQVIINKAQDSGVCKCKIVVVINSMVTPTWGAVKAPLTDKVTQSNRKKWSFWCIYHSKWRNYLFIQRVTLWCKFRRKDMLEWSFAHSSIFIDQTQLPSYLQPWQPQQQLEECLREHGNYVSTNFLIYLMYLPEQMLQPCSNGPISWLHCLFKSFGTN